MTPPRSKPGVALPGSSTPKEARQLAAEAEAAGAEAVWALDVRREPRAVRERYGPTTVGQSLLMARRVLLQGSTLLRPGVVFPPWSPWFFAVFAV